MVIQSVLVIGGSGFVGRAVVSALLASGYDVSVLDICPSFPDDVRVKTFTASYQNAEAVESILSNCYNVVIHLACTTTPSSSNIDPYNDVVENLVPTINLIELCAKYDVSKFIYASSGGAIYGDPVELPATEDLCPQPVSSYGIVKSSVERYLYLFQLKSTMNFVSLRMANPYGPGQMPKSGFGAVPTFISRIMKNETISVFGDGLNERDYVYIDDVVEAFIKSILADVSGVFNIGFGKGVSVLKLINAISNEIGVVAKIDHLASRESDVRKIYLDITKASNVLNWKPVVELNTGIHRTVMWFKACYAEKDRY